MGVDRWACLASGMAIQVQAQATTISNMQLFMKALI
jgi:hypothetical protein